MTLRHLVDQHIVHRGHLTGAHAQHWACMRRRRQVFSRVRRQIHQILDQDMRQGSICALWKLRISYAKHLFEPF